MKFKMDKGLRNTLIGVGVSFVVFELFREQILGALKNTSKELAQTVAEVPENIIAAGAGVVDAATAGELREDATILEVKALEAREAVRGAVIERQVKGAANDNLSVALEVLDSGIDSETGEPLTPERRAEVEKLVYNIEKFLS